MKKHCIISANYSAVFGKTKAMSVAKTMEREEGLYVAVYDSDGYIKNHYSDGEPRNFAVEFIRNNKNGAEFDYDAETEWLDEYYSEKVIVKHEGETLSGTRREFNKKFQEQWNSCNHYPRTNEETRLLRKADSVLCALRHGLDYADSEWEWCMDKKKHRVCYVDKNGNRIYPNRWPAWEEWCYFTLRNIN